MTRLPVPIRDAVTVALLRDSSRGIEAWLLTRVQQMVFAGGMSVFPGGRVEAEDAALPFTEAAADFVASRFECGKEEALALLGAGAREVFEETGVLFTDRQPQAVLSELSVAVEAGEHDFGDLLRKHELTLKVDGMHPFARWVTPEKEPRRYDTRFFLAKLPDGAFALDLTSESSTASWECVHDVEPQIANRERVMLPPTRVTIEWLAAFDTVEDALSAADERPLTVERPIMVFEPGRSITTLASGRQIETLREAP